MRSGEAFCDVFESGAASIIVNCGDFEDDEINTRVLNRVVIVAYRIVLSSLQITEGAHRSARSDIL